MAALGSFEHAHTWLAEHRAVRVRPLFPSDEGNDADSLYVELFWIPVLGPAGVAIMRRLALWLAWEPDGYVLDVDELAALMGMGRGDGRHSRIVRSLVRLISFRLAQLDADAGALLVRASFPNLGAGHVRNLPPTLRSAHNRITEERNA